MPELFKSKRPVGSVFSLLGEQENHITFSLGWAFSRSPHLLKAFLKKVLPSGVKFEIDDLEIVLQEHKAKHGAKGKIGITDIEIREKTERRKKAGNSVHVIIEAKRGWSLPTPGQLKKYVPRLKRTQKEGRLIVTMSECSSRYASPPRLPLNVDGIKVKHVSWGDIAKLTKNCEVSHAEKQVLQELHTYLATIVNMQKQDSNWVYVVSLGNTEEAPGLTYKQIVNERRRYYHPYGKDGWPKDPPNYLGFRYEGKLQSIHHVEHSEKFTNFHDYFPECPDKEREERVIYKLGPAIRPSHDVKSGKVVMAQRVRAMLDLLLTCKTISEAVEKSKKREALDE